MNRRTFEILANWISHDYNIQIKFDPMAQQPSADLKTKTVILPTDFKEEQSFSILATLMHEAAHIRYTKCIPDSLTNSMDASSKSILNVIEDLRIDRYNFARLDNIHDFYEEMMKENYNENIDCSKMSLLNKVLYNAIVEGENFGKYKLKAPDADGFIINHQVTQFLNEGIRDIELRDWESLRQKIADFRKLFPEDPPDPPSQTPLPTVVRSFPGNGHREIPPIEMLGEVAIEEQTRKNFSELLSIKSERIVDEGNQLNTANLTNFFTGELEGLFTESEIKKDRKSKVVFLLDASGSMTNLLIDGQEKRQVLVKCINSFVRMIQEIQAVEGLAVDWDVHCFNDNWHALPKKNWTYEYSKCSGGTNLLRGFTKSHETLIKDTSVDGKKMLVVVSDGDVYDDEVNKIKDIIITQSEDIRFMMLGINKEPSGEYFKLTGYRIIMTEEHASSVMLDTIIDMLRG